MLRQAWHVECDVSMRSSHKIRRALASLDSIGVPGIGTRALTGNDSGCSGMLKQLINNYGAWKAGVIRT